jgi:hypothetical protein
VISFYVVLKKFSENITKLTQTKTISEDHMIDKTIYKKILKDFQEARRIIKDKKA